MVEYIKLQCTNLGTQDNMGLARMISPKNKTDKLVVVLEKNNIHDEQLGHVLLIMKEYMLYKLRISANQIADTSAQALVQLFQGSKCNNNLVTLMLFNNGINDDILLKILPGIQHLKELRTLDLTHNQDISIHGFRQLASFLKFNCSNLANLSISNNNIGRQCIFDLCQYYIKSCALEFLDLSNNPLEDTGISYLVIALCDNENLKTLKLTNTKASDIGANYICILINSPACPESLYLDSNSFTFKGIKKMLVQGINVKKLKKLSILRNKIDCQREIQAYLHTTPQWATRLDYGY